MLRQVTSGLETGADIQLFHLFAVCEWCELDPRGGANDVLEARVHIELGISRVSTLARRYNVALKADRANLATDERGAVAHRQSTAGMVDRSISESHREPMIWPCLMMTRAKWSKMITSKCRWS